MFTRFELGSERYFTEEQTQIVDAIFEAILPGTEDSPGARDAGAADYLSALLALGDSAYYEIKGWRSLYTKALAALDVASASLNGGRGVAALTAGEATDLLRKLSTGALEGMPADVDQRRLFATLRNHCIEGCFVDPRWGGNRDGVMWDWLGNQYPPRDFHRTSATGARRAAR